MNTKIQKWDNSLALRIPKAFAAQAHLTQGSVVDLEVVDGRLIVQPARRGAYSLDELLAGISRKNLHSEVQAAPAVGREAW